MKKFVSGVLSLLMLSSLFAGCSGDQGAGGGSSGGSSGDSTGPLSFSVTTVNFGEAPTGKLIQEAWLDEMEKLMGRELDIDFQYVAMADYPEKIKIMLTSQELADLTTSWGMTQKDIFSYGAKGTFVELSEKLDQLPNYKKHLENSPGTKDTLYSEDGKLYAFYAVGTGWQEYSGGSNEIGISSAFRKDIFDANNIPLPETVEDVYNAAKKLKEIYPDKYPIMQMEEWQPPINMFMASNHFGGTYQTGSFDGMYYDGETYAYAPLTENYKEALVELNKWYEEELISPDFFTQTQADGNAAIASGDGMIIPGAYYGYPGTWNAQYSDQEWVLKVGVENPEYGEPWAYNMGYMDDTYVRNNWGVLVNSKANNMDDILQFMDYQMSDSINELFSWGVEGETYTVVDGKKQHTPEASEKQQELAFGNGNCRPGVFPQIQDMVATQDQLISQPFLDDGKLTDTTIPEYIKDNFTVEQAMPLTRMNAVAQTEDEAEEYASIMTPINTYAAEQMAAFISGTRSFDEWDAYVEEIKAMGDLDRAIEINNKTITGAKAVE